MKIFVRCLFLFGFSCEALLAQGTITFEAGATDLGTVVQSETISGDVYATISTTDALAFVDIYDYGAPLGKTSMATRDYASNGANNAVVTFSKPVNVTSIFLFDGYSHNNIYAITPTPMGSNVVKNGSFAAYSGETVVLNFSNINSFSISSSNLTAIGIDNIIINDVLPVELTSFTGSSFGKNIALNWQTATEKNNYGFEVERRIPLNPPLVKGEAASAEGDWRTLGFVQGNGNSNSTKYYSFTDVPPYSIIPGVLFYRLKQIDTDGMSTYSYEIQVEVTQLPEEFMLYQNYPNPCNPTTTIKYSIPSNPPLSPFIKGGSGEAEGDLVTLKVYDVLGDEIATLVNEQKEAGSYEVEFGGSQFPSGVYFYKLTAGAFTSSKKLVLMK